MIVNNRLINIVFWIVLCLHSQLLWAQSKPILKNFDITSEYADVSLIEFAKQADLTRANGSNLTNSKNNIVII
jgi:hypothetical protein